MANRRTTSTKRSPAPAQILDRIRKGDLSPLYFLYGPEEFEKEEVLKALIDTALEPSARAFNLDILYAEDLDAADTVNRAIAFPMMAARRVVVVKRVERLPEPAARHLLPLIQTPPATTLLVFTAGKIDARKKLFAELRKSALSAEFRPPFDNKIPDWIRRRAETLGKRIEPEAVHLLHLSVGSQLPDLANELDKLAISTDGRQTITREDVDRVVGNTRGATVFELSDAVGHRRVGPALAVLKRLLEQGDHPVGIVAMLIRHIGILRKARWLQGHRLPRAELAKQLSVPPFFLPGYMEQAARFDDRTLWQAYDALLEADNRLKTRSRTPAVTLSGLVYRLCRAPQPAVPPSEP